MVNDSFAPLLELAADVDDVLHFRRAQWGKLRDLGSLRTLLGQLRATPFDLVIDFQGLLRSGLLTAVARARHKVGFATGREGSTLFYGQDVAPPPGIQHAVERNLYLLGQALGEAETPAYETPLWDLPPALAARADALWQEAGLHRAAAVIAVAPAARWASKSWPPAFFAAAMREVADRVPNLAFWLVGAPADAAAGAALMAAQPPAATADLIGRTDMPLLLALLRRSRAMLTNDSGPMHLAAACGVPTVALFGPTSPELTGPYGPNHRIIMSQVDCAPCMQRHCPLPRQLCLDDIASPARAGRDLAACLGI